MNTAEWIGEVGPSCPVCGADTQKAGATAAADGGEQTDGLAGEVVWACAGCGHTFEDEAIGRQNEAARASAARLSTLARELMRTSDVYRKP
jgi:rubredoxin